MSGLLLLFVVVAVVWWFCLCLFIQPALGLLLADGGWGRLFGASAGFFYENDCNSETKSRKIDPKEQNGSSFRQGLQTGH